MANLYFYSFSWIDEVTHVRVHGADHDHDLWIFFYYEFIINWAVVEISGD